jgi:hypothetical protein
MQDASVLYLTQDMTNLFYRIFGISMFMCRVLILNILVCGVFHTLLLAVPHNIVTIKYPMATAHLGTPPETWKNFFYQDFKMISVL